MIRRHKASARAHVYNVGDLVKVSTSVLLIKRTPTQSGKLTQKYVGPFDVIAVSQHGTVTLNLPQHYSRVHNVFNVCDVRPWMHDGTNEIDVSYPAVLPQPSYNPVVQILDRQRAPGRIPAHLSSLLDIHAEYFVVRHDGSTEWLHQSRLQEPEERILVKEFERRYKRTEDKKCVSVKHYKGLVEDYDEDYGSDDEVDLAWENQLSDYFGPDRLPS